MRSSPFSVANMILLCFSPALPVTGAGVALTTGACGVRRVCNSAMPPSTPPQMKKGGSGKKKAVPARAAGTGFAAPTVDTFHYTGNLRPGVQTPRRKVPPSIPRPDYAADGKPKAKQPKFPWNIEIKTAEEIDKMRVSGRIAREVLDIAGRSLRVGITTDEIDAIVHDATIARGAYPSPLNYCGFPKSCCTSLNEIVCHGIPDSTVLRDGDIVNIDITCYYDGFHGDCSEMYLIGDVDEAGKHLVRSTYECLEKAMAVCKPDAQIKHLGGVIEEHATKVGLSVVRNFCGHGIGSVFHTTPNVMHYKNNEPAGIMKPGMVFTIEPMICEGTHKNVTWPDNWTAATSDGKRSAQFEHTFLITKTGVEALTGKLPGSPKFFWEE
jgi:methionyl aminopeptidase